MAIDFDLTNAQSALRARAREFARDVIAPMAGRADAISDPHAAFLATQPAYEQAHRLGWATGFVPTEFGGGGTSHVDFVIAAEELCAADPGFVTTLLVNGLATMPIVWYGSKAQKQRWLPLAAEASNRRFLAGWAVSERGGSANFDHPHAEGGLQLTAVEDRKNGEYVLNGEKHWPCNAGGWDLGGSDFTLGIARIDAGRGKASTLGAFVVQRGADGVSFEVIDKGAHRTCQNVTMTFRDVCLSADDFVTLTEGDLLISRNFTWSGPLAGIAAVGVARAAYDFALDWSKTYTGGGTTAIIGSPVVGALLVDIAARIEAARTLCWKSAHYIDRHEGAAHALSAMSKTYVSESMLQVVIDCMRVVGVNALDRRFPMEKYYREAMVFPLYDAGNIGMQRRRAWGVLADPRYTSDLFVDAAPLAFDRSMHAHGVIGRRG